MPTLGEWRRFPALAVPLLWLCAAVATCVVWLWWLPNGGVIDVRVYRAGGYAWLHDIDLYGPAFNDVPGGTWLPFTYPPAAAAAFAPMSLLPFRALTVANAVVGFVALTATLAVVAWVWSGRRRGRAALAAAVNVGMIGASVAAFALEPVRETFAFGQINLVLLTLVVVDLLVLRNSKWSGVLTGLAAALKLTPLAFGLVLVLRRDWRGVANLAGTFAGVGLLAALIDPATSRTYWFHTLTDPGRIGGLTFSTNQSLRGVIERLGVAGSAAGPVWVVAVLGTLALAVVAGLRSVRRGDDIELVLTVAAAGLLCSPVSWSHHWVWVAPLIVGYVLAIRDRLGTGSWGRLVPSLLFLVAVFGIAPFQLVADRGRVSGPVEQLASAAYVLVALGLLVVVALGRELPSSRRSMVPPATPRRGEPAPEDGQDVRHDTVASPKESDR